MKIFIRFPKQFFLQNDFIDTKNAVLTGRQKFFLLDYWKWSKKSPQKMQELFEKLFFKKFPWRGRKQLESSADFFRTASRKFSIRYSKEQIVNFAKNFHPKVSTETENPVSTTPLLCFARIGQKNRWVSKKEKNIGKKTLLR